MNDSIIPPLIGVLVYLAMRFVDALIPRGRHFKFIERWTTEDTPSSDSPSIDEA